MANEGKPVKRKNNIVSALFLMCAVVMLPSVNSAAPYYEGKRISIVVGFPPGGGYDRMARLLQKHLPKYIPGKPTIIVENMDGAGTIVAANYIYNIAKPDGLTIGTFSKGLPASQLVKAPGVKFDIRKFAWIGSSAVEATVLCLRSDLPYKTVDDIRKTIKPIYMLGAGPASVDQQFPTLLKEYAGLNFKIVQYPSSAAGMIAIEQGELDGRAGSYSAFRPFIERGLVRPMIRGRVSEPDIEKLPVNEDLTSNPRGKTVMGMLSIQDKAGRPYAAPPGTPPEVMNILKEAFSKFAKDPEATEEAKKVLMTVDYVPPEECMKIFHFILEQPEDITNEFKKYINF